MKIFTPILFAFVSLFAFFAFAQEPTLAVPEENKAQPVTGTCYAETYCPRSDMVIYCQTWGDSCTWYVKPNRYVKCTGYDSYGYWVSFVNRC